MKCNNHFNYTDSQSRHFSVWAMRLYHGAEKKFCSGIGNQCMMNKMSYINNVETTSK